MTVDFLVKLHELVWKDDDNMDQETLEELQELVDKELVWLEHEGKVELVKLENGFIKSIKVVES